MNNKKRLLRAIRKFEQAVRIDEHVMKGDGGSAEAARSAGVGYAKALDVLVKAATQNDSQQESVTRRVIRPRDASVRAESVTVAAPTAWVPVTNA